MRDVLPMQCAACGVALDVQFVERPDSKQAKSQTFCCPVCKAEHRTELAGQITYVSRRPEPSRRSGGRPQQRRRP